MEVHDSSSAAAALCCARSAAPADAVITHRWHWCWQDVCLSLRGECKAAQWSAQQNQATVLSISNLQGQRLRHVLPRTICLDAMWVLWLR